MVVWCGFCGCHSADFSFDFLQEGTYRLPLHAKRIGSFNKSECGHNATQSEIPAAVQLQRLGAPLFMRAGEHHSITSKTALHLASKSDVDNTPEHPCRRRNSHFYRLNEVPSSTEQSEATENPTATPRLNQKADYIIPIDNR